MERPDVRQLKLNVGGGGRSYLEAGFLNVVPAKEMWAMAALDGDI